MSFGAADHGISPVQNAGEVPDEASAANRPTMNHFKTPEQAREELETLQDLSVAMREHSVRMVQLFDSMIESHRALAQVQRAHQWEINAIQSQVRTLLAQAGNAQFNTQ